MHIVCVQTKAKRCVNQEEYCVMDLGNHMNVSAKHWQVAAQDYQNIQHSYPLTLPMMKQSQGCFWPLLFWDFLSCLSQLMSKPCLQTMWLQRMLSAFAAGAPLWEAEGKVALDSEAQNANITNTVQNFKFTPGYHVYKSKQKYFAC